jgi:L-rhamnonate dehydratase
MKDTKVSSIDVYLVETAIRGNFADSTRHVETIGYVVVDVCTTDGIHGVGLTYNEVGGEAIKEMIELGIAPKIIGRSPLETEALYEESFHYIRGVGRKGLSFCAYSAVDIALWDIKAKMLGLPLYRLLGGARRRLPAYASGGWTSYSREELVQEALMMVGRGYKTIKLKVGVDGGKNPNEDVRRIAAVREAIGPDIGLMVDANNAFISATAVQLGNRLRDYDIMLFEEPVFADDLPGLAHFRQCCDIPLATGEHEYTRYGVRDLLLAGAVDILQVDVTRCGGVTEILKIIALSQAWNISFAPHGMDAMHMHLLSAAPNGIYLERLFMFEDVSRMVFVDAPEPVDGFITLDDEPGLGLHLNYDTLRATRKGRL